jgi:hypothetical protein
MPRDMIENERGSTINPTEAVEKRCLSDRLACESGLLPAVRISIWLGGALADALD